MTLMVLIAISLRRVANFCFDLTDEHSKVPFFNPETENCECYKRINIISGTLCTNNINNINNIHYSWYVMYKQYKQYKQ